MSNGYHRHAMAPACSLRDIDLGDMVMTVTITNRILSLSSIYGTIFKKNDLGIGYVLDKSCYMQ